MHKLPTKSFIIIVCLTITAAVCLMTLDNVLPAKAQTTTEPWSEPVNLSHSGAATSPYLVVDNQGIVHVFWEDEYAGTTYTSRVDGVWQPPSTGEFPFSTFSPTLLATEAGWIHAFWIGEEQELFASRAPTSDVGNAFSWEPSRQLANTAIALDATVDERGTIHLTYLRPIDEEGSPAGIYYRRTIDNAGSWFVSELLYESAYFRSLTPENSNLKIASSETDDQINVFVVFDNPQRKQILLRHSYDSGENWEPIEEIAGPDSEQGSNQPANISISALDNNVLLIWQESASGGTCQQHFQYSATRGETWSVPQPLQPDIQGCSQESAFKITSGGLTILFTVIYNRPYLTAWDGARWSFVQPQDELVGFRDPEIFTQVSMGCHAIDISPSDELLAVGCDLGTGEDIWQRSRAIGDVNTWFPPPPVWSEFTPIYISGTPISSPKLVADNANVLHAIWYQAADDQSMDNTAIYHSSQDIKIWSKPSAIFSSINGYAGELAVVADSRGRIHIGWIDKVTSELNYSWVDSPQANNLFEWAEPIIVTTPSGTVSSPSIVVEKDQIYIIYALTLNDNRGVYMTNSSDHGATWLDPALVFDAQAAGWEMVDDPHFSITGDGIYHALWTQMSHPQGIGPLGLYYSQSRDSGESWSDPEVVQSGPVNWSQMDAPGQNIVHITWMESKEPNEVLRHRYSVDSGLTWVLSPGLPILGDLLSHPSLSASRDGQLHLNYPFQSGQENFEIAYWLWADGRWTIAEGTELLGNFDFQHGAVSNDVGSDNRLGIIIVADSTASLPDTPIQENMIFSERVVKLGEDIMAEEPIAEMPSDTQIPTATTGIINPTAATPTQSISENALLELPSSDRGNSWSGIIIAIILVSVIVGGLSIMYILFVRNRSQH